MAQKEKKRSIFARIRNYFIAGIVVLIPIGITIYLTLFIVKISSNNCLYFVCGPTNFVENISNTILDLGIKYELIKTERFG